MNASEISKQRRIEVAKRLAALHPGLEINQVGDYTSLRIEPGKLKACIVVSRTADKASFLIRNSELLDAIKAARLKVIPKTSRAKAFAGFEYRVLGVSIQAVDRNQELFKKLVDESVKLVMELQKGNMHG
jgi:hypothetical protein